MTSQWEEAVLNMVAASRHMYCSFGKSERLKERAKKPDLISPAVIILNDFL